MTNSKESKLMTDHMNDMRLMRRGLSVEEIAKIKGKPKPAKPSKGKK
jgi:hypothetical protein